MNDNRTRIYIERQRMFGDQFAVHMGRKASRGWAVAHPVQWEVIDEDCAVATQPAFCLNKDEAQAFMDELWNVGFRPTEGSGSAGAMAAVQAHLKDMQRLVFDPPKKGS